ncbi:Soluble aldose sugar dehydrogenase yliI precursor [Raoultella planticola]|uniref:Soluble aldose sugar dehydrogenase yliI n=1 Tax=Raoultella planticola TaxID=575 RepID=A0A485AV11_RAOPL|nr:Soluble aldose sugar dehydrogenase yliI precursor [Raoultella planticola]
MNPWTDTLWLNEHGPRGATRSISAEGKNYGWPLATHGVNYSGLAIPEAQARRSPELKRRFSSGSGLRR